MALALGLPKTTGVEDQIREFVLRCDRFPVAPQWRADPPWAQNTLTGPDVDLFQVLPLVRLNEGDAGLYIDKAAVVSNEPAPITAAPLTGLPVPWGSEVVIEGIIEGHGREIEGPFGEFTGRYSGGPIDRSAGVGRDEVVDLGRRMPR